MVTVGCQEAMFLILRALRAAPHDVLLAVAPDLCRVDRRGPAGRHAGLAGGLRARTGSTWPTCAASSAGPARPGCGRAPAT